MPKINPLLLMNQAAKAAIAAQNKKEDPMADGPPAQAVSPVKDKILPGDKPVVPPQDPHMVPMTMEENPNVQMTHTPMPGFDPGADFVGTLAKNKRKR